MTKKIPDLTGENSIAIFPERPERLRVERPQAAIGFLYVDILGRDAGRIVFDRTKGKLELMFNQTVFSLANSTKVQKEFSRAIRKQICEKLGGVDTTKD